MKITSYFYFILIISLLINNIGLFGSDEKDEEKIPEIGSLYRHSKADWYVRGAGKESFEYTATGESLCIITQGIPGSIVKVPKKGAVVKIDPQVPMIYIDKKPDKGLQSNTYFRKKAKGKVFILLEYKRD